MYKALIAALAILAVTGCASAPSTAGGSEGDYLDVLLKFEGEKFNREEGGSVIIMDDRPSTSGGLAFRDWNYPGHALEWDVEVTKEADYVLAVRVASGRAWSVYREVKIDGQLINPKALSYVLPTTGGFGQKAEQWKEFYFADDKGNPATFKLKPGKHVLRITNLGGGSEGDGASNLDYFYLAAGDSVETFKAGFAALLPGAPAVTK